MFNHQLLGGKIPQLVVLFLEAFPGTHLLLLRHLGVP